MIVKIKINEKETFLFGDSYKKWSMQFEEFLYDCKREKREIAIQNVLVSENSWIKNGLKWCKLEYFQEELDEENQGREVSSIRFYTDDKITRKVNKLVQKVFK